jgi:hypothetical protein
MSFETDATHTLLSLDHAADGKRLNFGASEKPIMLPLPANLYQRCDQN